MLNLQSIYNDIIVKNTLLHTAFSPKTHTTMKATVVFWNDFVLTRDFWAFERATYEITILEEKRERELIEKINKAAGNVSK